MEPEQRGRVRRLHHRGNWRQEDPVSAADKPFSIDKRLVYEAYKAVRANAGAAGVDGQTIAQFEADLRGNLYKLWNKMSSGAYFPPPVRAVAIAYSDETARVYRSETARRSDLKAPTIPVSNRPGWCRLVGRFRHVTRAKAGSSNRRQRVCIGC